MNHLEDEGFYGVNCINCGKPICLKRWKGIVSDAELPNSHCYDAHPLPVLQRAMRIYGGQACVLPATNHPAIGSEWSNRATQPTLTE